MVSFVVMFLWWCFCGGVCVVGFVVVWWCCCGGVVVFLWWCLSGGVFVMVFVWWCLSGGVFAGGVVHCFCGGVVGVVFLWWCGGVGWWCFLVFLMVVFLTVVRVVFLWCIFVVDVLAVVSRKRPRRVLSKKALPLKTVIKDCHQTSPKVLLK